MGGWSARAARSRIDPLDTDIYISLDFCRHCQYSVDALDITQKMSNIYMLEHGTICRDYTSV